MAIWLYSKETEFKKYQLKINLAMQTRQFSSNLKKKNGTQMDITEFTKH